MDIGKPILKSYLDEPNTVKLSRVENEGKLFEYVSGRQGNNALASVFIYILTLKLV